MNLFSRFLGVFFNPKETFKAVSEKPVWLDTLVILFIAIGLFSYIVAPYAQRDSVQMWKDNAVKLQERLGKEGYERQLKKLENPSSSSVLLRSFLLSPITFLFGFLFSSLILLGAGRLFSVQGNYRQLLSAYLQANFIDKILGNGVRLILILTKKSVMQTSTSLVLLFPRLEFTSPLYVVLSQIDFFQLWLFGIFSLALVEIFKIERKKALFISYGFWFIKSLLYIAMGLLTLKYMR